MSPSWSPVDKLLFIPALEECDIYVTSEHNPEPMHDIAGGGGGPVPGHPGEFYLRAVDPITGERRWQQRMTGPAEMWAGTVATAGGLVFYGDDGGNLVAVNSATGQILWHYYTGQSLYASPMTYSVEGKQYVAIAAGADVFAFGLFEAAEPFERPKETVR
jgi:alcohol dehydrogenase (cytochrome c)